MSEHPPPFVFSYMYCFGHIHYLSLSVNLWSLDELLFTNDPDTSSETV